MARKNKFIDQLNAKLRQRDDLVYQGIEVASLAFLIDVYEILGDSISMKKYKALEDNLNDIYERIRSTLEQEGPEMAALILSKDVEEIRKLKQMDK